MDWYLLQTTAIRKRFRQDVVRYIIENSLSTPFVIAHLSTFEFNALNHLMNNPEINYLFTQRVITIEDIVQSYSKKEFIDNYLLPSNNPFCKRYIHLIEHGKCKLYDTLQLESIYRERKRDVKKKDGLYTYGFLMYCSLYTVV
jgi:hypothetical protein